MNINIIMKSQRERDIFLTFIREKGLRHTSQRDVILNAFLASGEHCTIDDLYNAISVNHPEIGYATVHRNMNLLCEAGLAEEIKIGRQKTRYEMKIGREHHDHLICEKCGKLIEVHDDKIEELQIKLAEANDFIPRRHKLEIYGICSSCK